MGASGGFAIFGGKILDPFKQISGNVSFFAHLRVPLDADPSTVPAVGQTNFSVIAQIGRDPALVPIHTSGMKSPCAAIRALAPLFGRELRAVAHDGIADRASDKPA